MSRERISINENNEKWKKKKKKKKKIYIRSSHTGLLRMSNVTKQKSQTKARAY